MFRVLIVEDEMLVRLGLKNSIDWAKFDMTVIADAADGQAAEQIYLKEKPDLIITDIKMPVMDGMELIARIRAQDKDTKIIILSCLDEFELARKAMSLGVSEYILKLSMSEEEIEAILRRVQGELAARGVKVLAGQSQLGAYDTKEKHIKEFIYYGNRDEKAFAAYVNKAGLRLHPGGLIVCIMHVDHFGALQAAFSDPQGQRIKSALLAILEDIMSRYGRGEAIYDSGPCYMLIFSFPDSMGENESHKELMNILSNIKSVVSTHLNACVSFGISGFANGYGSLNGMYTKAREALSQKFFSGSGMFFAAGPSCSPGQTAGKIASLKRHPKLLSLLGEEAAAEFNAKADAFIDAGLGDGSRILAFFSHIAQWLTTLLRLKENKPLELFLWADEKIRECETLDEAIEAFQGFLSVALDETVRSRGLSKEVSEALQYVQNNYSRNVSLTQAAGHVGLSPNYLGNLFKKELKVGFNEYLSDLRIEKAKELLLNTYLKSYEISERVGFSESTYFCRVFKKATGYSPNEFRSRLMKEWTEDMDNDHSREN